MNLRTGLVGRDPIFSVIGGAGRGEGFVKERERWLLKLPLKF
jgi:hypothetical protein